MASIRKREWVAADGTTKAAWVVDYFDADRKRRLKTFERKKDAEAWRTTMAGEVRDGTHLPDSTSATVAQAGEAWIAQAEADGLERATVGMYRRHLDLHISPAIGDVKLSRLSVSTVRDFETRLREAGQSRANIKKIVASLGAILADANAPRNVVRDAMRSRRKRDGKSATGRQKKARVVIPTKAELRALMDGADGMLRPFLITAIFTGLRSSELRGLEWKDVDLTRKVLTVRQRVDQFGQFGPPKSDAGFREIPLSPLVVNTLKAWKLKCPKRGATKDKPGELWLVFPNGGGGVEPHSNLVNRAFGPLQVRLGLVKPRKGGSMTLPVIEEAGSEWVVRYRPADGPDATRAFPSRKEAEAFARKIAPAPRYGLHALRHAFVAQCIEHGMSPKRIQVLAGHSSVAMTLDVYGHLWPSDEADQKAMALIEARLVG